MITRSVRVLALLLMPTYVGAAVSIRGKDSQASRPEIGEAMGSQHVLIGLLALLLWGVPARAAEIAVCNVALPTTNGGTVDCTSSGFGTPKGALMWGGFGTVNGTAADNAGFFIGAYDGTNQNSIGATNGDGLTDSDTGGATDSNSAYITLTNAHVKDGDCTASFITDGVRLTCATAPPSAYRVNMLLFGGTGVSNVFVGTATGNAAIGGTTAVTGPGFTPDFVAAFSSYGTNAYRVSIGLATKEGASIVQRTMANNENDANASMQETGTLVTNRLVTNTVIAKPSITDGY